MSNAINEEAIKAVKAAFGKSPWNPNSEVGHGIKIEQHKTDKGCVVVDVDCSVHDQVDFSHLLVMSEAFGTKNINVGNYERWGGCETCGHGEYHHVEVYIRDCTKGLIGC